MLLAAVEREAERFLATGIAYTGHVEADLGRVVAFYHELVQHRGRVIVMLVNEIPRHLGLDVPALYRRAAAWLQGQGRAREAVAAWLAAETYAEALPLLARLVPELMRRGEMSTVAR